MKPKLINQILYCASRYMIGLNQFYYNHHRILITDLTILLGAFKWRYLHLKFMFYTPTFLNA